MPRGAWQQRAGTRRRAQLPLSAAEADASSAPFRGRNRDKGKPYRFRRTRCVQRSAEASPFAIASLETTGGTSLRKQPKRSSPATPSKQARRRIAAAYAVLWAGVARFRGQWVSLETRSLPARLGSFSLFRAIDRYEAHGGQYMRLPLLFRQSMEARASRLYVSHRTSQGVFASHGIHSPDQAAHDLSQGHHPVHPPVYALSKHPPPVIRPEPSAYY